MQKNDVQTSGKTNFLESFSLSYRSIQVVEKMNISLFDFLKIRI